MSIEYRESQFELFPGTADSYPRIEKQRFYFSSLTLNFDTIVVLSIIIVMLMVLSFSLGVERGKRVIVSKMAATRQPTPAVLVAPETHKTINIHSPSRIGNPAAAPADPPQQIIETFAENVKSVYTVQVASFKQAKYAHQEANNLKNKGYDIFVLQKGSHFIVGVGRFNQKAEAKVLSSKLKGQYKDCVIRSL
mgnify:CR=1 FL=1